MPEPHKVNFAPEALDDEGFSDTVDITKDKPTNSSTRADQPIIPLSRGDTGIGSSYATSLNQSQFTTDGESEWDDAGDDEESEKSKTPVPVRWELVHVKL